jgi:hypothetical protein
MTTLSTRKILLASFVSGAPARSPSGSLKLRRANQSDLLRSPVMDVIEVG